MSSITPPPLQHAAMQPLPHAGPPGLQLWLVDLDAYAAQTPLDGLSAEEHRRAGRMVFALQARRALARWHALRTLLGAALSRPPGDLVFAIGAQGKPAVADSHGGLQFNLSHREHLALVGLHGHLAVGVDIELPRPLDDLDSLAAAILSDAEHTDWTRLDPAQRAAHFLACWTRKEACVKALGVGLSAPPARIETGSGPEHRLMRLPSSDPSCPIGTIGTIGPLDLPDLPDPLASRVPAPDEQAHGEVAADEVKVHTLSLPGLHAVAACALAGHEAVRRAQRAWG